MQVNEIKPNYLILEYRQDTNDDDYGSCLWARFAFNLDRYELSITSDCGNYGYKWAETPEHESFLQLMARVENGYMLEKMYGSPDVFDYDKTKEKAYKTLAIDDNDKIKLDDIFWSFESDWIPETSEAFCIKFDELGDSYFPSECVWELPVLDYPSNVKKIISVFTKCIQPKIREKLIK